MKRLIASALILMSVVSVHAQSHIVVPLFTQGSVYIVPCKVNGVSLEMILDTGASTICISEAVAEEMYEEGHISDEDILGWSQAQMADGRVVDCLDVIFRDVEIGGLHLYDVEGVIIEGENAGLLLGQTVLRRLGSYSIVGRQLIIEKSADPEKDEAVESLLEQAEVCLAVGNYLGTISPLEEMRMLSIISPYGMAKLVQSYSKTQQYEKCLSSFRAWERDYEEETECIDRCDTYLAAANALINCTRQYDQAKSYLVEATRYLDSYDYEDVSDRYAELYALVGDFYVIEGKENDAASAYKIAISHRMEFLGINAMDIYKGDIRDTFLSEHFYLVACLCAINSLEFAVFICSAQKLGNSDARAYLEAQDRLDRCKIRYRAWIEQVNAQDNDWLFNF